MPETREVIIIGSGPAAWTAAIYTARALLKPLVIAGEQGGGQLMFTTEVENYPGFETGILGPELMTAMRQQAERLSVEIIDQNATAITKPGDLFSVSLTSPNTPNTLTARAVIIATGATANTLHLPGEDQLMGRGVGTCAVCDAPFFKGRKQVFVVGGGDSAVEEAGELAKFAQHVVMLVRRDQLRASPILQQRITRLQNIEIWYNADATELIGDKVLTQVKVTRQGRSEVHPADGLFYAIGHAPATKFLAGSGVTLDAKGYILTPLSTVISGQSFQLPNAYPTATSLRGVFAAGDCVDPRYRQAITAAGFGCMAALDAQRWLERNSA